MHPMDHIAEKTSCYHCGEDCNNKRIQSGDKLFCCEGCKMVYEILNKTGLCDYYSLNNNPGLNQRMAVRKDKFAFLDDETIAAQLISFKSPEQEHVTFYLPQMHCSSCLYLLENLHKLDEAVISSKVNFIRKEAEIVFNPQRTSLRKVAEIVTAIGYEPYISLNDLNQKRPAIDKSLIYQVGVAGFCFGNIMLMSFPEYFGIDASEKIILNLFRWINFGLAIPVFLYSALPFYQSSWKSLKHRFINIDAPIALAVIITFVRSAYEVISGTGSGYFDSMTGIVFFMLAGRIIQDKTYRQLSFERDYRSYFPIAVSVLKDEKETPVQLPAIQPGDTLLIHNEELVPADGILTRGRAFIDYSFVTGESTPVQKEMGELIYAGGKQTGAAIELLTVKEVAQSYLTKLWNADAFKKQEESKGHSFVHLLSRYFTLIVFTIATCTAAYWYINDAAKIWPAVTAIFIIACPCALLLSNTFTNGNVLTILSNNKFYLRDAATIEETGQTTHIVFDKTGTLTSTQELSIDYEGNPLTADEQQQVAALAACSSHPFGKALKHFLPAGKLTINDFKETAAAGAEGFINGDHLRIGTYEFITGEKGLQHGANIFISINGTIKGAYKFGNRYRESIPALLAVLKKNYKISVLSGDNEAERENLVKLMGKETGLYFHQQPEDKLRYIQQLQASGEKVMMIGDGLNDAGALKQSDVGIAVTEQSNNFTPSSSAILEAGQLSKLYSFIRLCKANRKIVIASFILSIVYNIIGIFFAIQGNLSPLIAAILMPSSSFSIFLVTFGSSSLVARWLKL